MRRTLFVLIAAMAILLPLSLAQARITRIDIEKIEPAYGDRSFGDVGPYEVVTGKAHGEVDPKLPTNAVIQDIDLAPRNAHGMVEYTTDIAILRPANPSHSNHILLFNVINRGNKGAVSLYNADASASLLDNNQVRVPGDGWLQRQGYTLIWFGWQGDVLPGRGRMVLKVPVARNPDGSPVTGLVRAEIVVAEPAKSVSISTSWFTRAGSHAAYPTVTVDNRKPFADGFLPTLTVRSRENAPHQLIPNGEWQFGACGATEIDPTIICLPAGFTPGHLYELRYRAKDPLVLGLGLAVARDMGTFLQTRDADDAGTANPVVHGPGVKSILTGTSQSGRFVRTVLLLGFNEAETGEARVFDAALPHIGGGLIALNIRFAQPGHAWGEQIDHLAPAYEFPFSYGRQTDPLTGRTAGVLDRCEATHTCPLIIHAATTVEMWEGRQSLGFTDPLGLRDVPDPPNVRTYIMASTQHSPALLPQATEEPFGACYQQSNPNPYTWTMRTLLDALSRWVRDGTLPPPGQVPTIAAGTLVAPDAVHFPEIPATDYDGVERPEVRFLGVNNPLGVYDRGPGYKAGLISGVITRDPPGISAARYDPLVPQVDADGNDLGGIRDLFVRVPVGTYTGWNLFSDDWFPNGFCSLLGSYIPFAKTKAERLKAGDPRLSIEERYPSKEAYVAAIRKAAADLVTARFMLPEDAARLVQVAELNGIRSNP
ncbi:MAG TPA: alpha/beta hydrolase domain-containing protein [Rhodopila sp.]|nr:alpha/beta hydrolase domain-containing protein [Rhodopila sp.]